MTSINISYINKLLIASEKETVTLEERIGEVIFKYLINTYKTIDSYDKEKHNLLATYTIIMTNSGVSRVLIQRSIYKKRKPIIRTYTINPSSYGR